MPDAEGSSILRTVTDEFQGTPLIAVTNLAASTQNASVECLGPQAGQKVAISPPSHATALLSGCAGKSHDTLGSFFNLITSASDHAVHGIEIIGDGDPGSLAAYAVAPHFRGEELVLSAAPFLDPGMIRSPDTVFAGVPIGAQPTLPNGVYVPRLTLTNFAATPAKITVSLSSTIKNRATSKDATTNVLPATVLRSLTIAPRQSQEIVFTGQEAQSGLLNSLYITSDRKAGEVQTKLVSRSTGSLYEIELLAKDGNDLNNGGIHPWTVENDAESHLLLYNHSKAQKKFYVGIWNGSLLWEKEYHLDPAETIEVSFNQLITDKVKDGKGQVLDPKLTHGVVNWMTPDSGDATGRLMVTSRQTNSARNFSCGNYTVLCGMYIITNTNYDGFIAVGEIQALYSGVGMFCNSYSPSQCYGASTGGGGASFHNSVDGIYVAFNESSEQYSSAPTLAGRSEGTGGLTMLAEGGGCSSGGGESPVVQLPGGLNVVSDSVLTGSEFGSNGCPNAHPYGAGPLDSLPST